MLTTMLITARYGTVLSWPETKGTPPFEEYYFCADFEVYFWRHGQRYRKRFKSVIFASMGEVPDTGSDVIVDFDEVTGEIQLA